MAVEWLRRDLQDALGEAAATLLVAEIHCDKNGEFVVTLELRDNDYPPQACLDLGHSGLGDAAKSLQEQRSSFLAALAGAAHQRSLDWGIVGETLKRVAES